MGDRTSVQIEIGGDLPASAVAEFLDLCEVESLTTDWSTAVTADDLVGRTESLTLCACDVNYGNLDELEPFLREHKLKYRKEWDAGGDYSSGAQVFNGEKLVECDSSGIGLEITIGATELRKLGSYEAIIARLDGLTFNLPPFKIVEP